MDEKIFVDGTKATDKTYNIINNEHENNDILSLKSYIEKLWVDYKAYADPDFTQKIKEDFDSRFWEMYLACTLIYKSYPVKKKTKSEGPDILIVEANHSIWLEAIAPTGGADDNLDRVPDMKYGVATNVPDEEITLRYCSAINDKIKKYLIYLEQKIVLPEDSFVIAINSCKIPTAIMDTNNPPRILKTVFPISYWRYKIDKNLHKIVDSRLQYRPNIKKTGGSKISTNIFLNPDYRALSGVLYSRVSIRSDKLEEMGSDFIYIHNPLAVENRIPEGYFKFGKEFIPKEDNEGYIIESREHS
jgi:type I restriction enzyme S subunit